MGGVSDWGPQGREPTQAHHPQSPTFRLWQGLGADTSHNRYVTSYLLHCVAKAHPSRVLESLKQLVFRELVAVRGQATWGLGNIQCEDQRCFLWDQGMSWMILEGMKEASASPGLLLQEKDLPLWDSSVVFAGGTNWDQDVMGEGQTPSHEGSLAASTDLAHVLVGTCGSRQHPARSVHEDNLPSPPRSLASFSLLFPYPRVLGSLALS